jgi:hypothetical protein
MGIFSNVQQQVEGHCNEVKNTILVSNLTAAANKINGFEQPDQKDMKTHSKCVSYLHIKALQNRIWRRKLRAVQIYAATWLLSFAY